MYSEYNLRQPNTLYYERQAISSSGSRKFDNNIIKLTKTKQLMSHNKNSPNTSPKQYTNNYIKNNENYISQVPYDNISQRNETYKHNSNQIRRHVIYNYSSCRGTEKDNEKRKTNFINEEMNYIKNDNLGLKFHKSPTNHVFYEKRSTNIKNDNSEKNSNSSQINNSNNIAKNYNSSQKIYFSKKNNVNSCVKDIIPNLREKLANNRSSYTNTYNQRVERYDTSDNQSENNLVSSDKFNSDKIRKNQKKMRTKHFALYYEPKKNDDKNNVEKNIKNENNNIKDNNIIITNNNICYITPIQIQPKKINNKKNKNLKEIIIKKDKEYSENKNKTSIIKNNYKNNIYYSFYNNSKTINDDNSSKIINNKNIILNNSTVNSNKKILSFKKSDLANTYNNKTTKNDFDKKIRNSLLPKNKIIKIQKYYRNYINKKKLKKYSKFNKHLLKFMDIYKKNLENIFMNLLQKNTNKKIINSLINRNNKLILKTNEINILHKELGDSFNIITENNLLVKLNDVIKENAELKNQLFDNKNIEERLNQLLIENKKNQNINAIIMKDNQLLAKKLKNFEAKKNLELVIQNQPSFDLTQHEKIRRSLSLINVEYIDKLKILYIKCLILKAITKYKNLLKKKFLQYKDKVFSQDNINNGLKVIPKYITINYLSKKMNNKKYIISNLIVKKEIKRKKILYKYLYKFYYISKFLKLEDDKNRNLKNRFKNFKITKNKLVIKGSNKNKITYNEKINDNKNELIKKLLFSIFHKYERNIYLRSRNILFEWKLRSVIFKMKNVAKEIKRKKKLKKKNREKLAKETLNKLKQKNEMLQSAHEFSYKIDKIENKCNKSKQEDSTSKISSMKEEKINNNDSEEDSVSSIGGEE